MKEVLQKIVPDTAERKRFQIATKRFLQQLNAKLNGAQAILGGSGAKDTWLAGNHDVDIFVTFDYKKYADRNQELSEILHKRLRLAFPKIRINRLHGSRDYFQLNFEQHAFETIPILKIGKAKEALNITDISPLHSVWVNKKTKTLKNEVRLAKQFCKANQLYGAESHLNGFSGYVLEILIAYYGSFKKLLSASQRWKVQEIIDPEKHYQKKMALLQINQSKLRSPLIVIDPVDKNRNASAALSLEKFTLFRKLAEQYLQKPQASCFEKKIIQYAELQQEAEKKKINLVYLEVQPLAGKIDVVGVKLLKIDQYLKQKLQQFEIIKSGWDWNKYYYFLKKKELPQEEIRAGPPIEMKEFVAAFQRKNKDTFVENGHLMARIRIEVRELPLFMKKILKDKYVQERIDEIETLKID